MASKQRLDQQPQQPNQGSSLRRLSFMNNGGSSVGLSMKGFQSSSSSSNSRSFSSWYNNNNNNQIDGSVTILNAKKKNDKEEDEDDEEEFKEDVFHDVINGEEVDDDDDEYEYEDDEDDEYEDDDDEYEDDEEEEEIGSPTEDDEISKSQSKILNKLEEMETELRLEQNEYAAINTSTYVNFAQKEEAMISKKQEKDLWVDTSASAGITEDELQQMFQQFKATAKNMQENNEKNNEDNNEENDGFPENDDWVYSMVSQGGNVTKETLTELQTEYNTLVKNQKDLLNENKNPTQDTGGLLKNIDFMIDDEYILSSENSDISESVKQEIMNVDYWAESDEDPNKFSIRESRRRLIYDLDYNVTNLFLSSVKVNPDAPFLLENWLLALRNQTKYEYVRLNHFNFTWDDVLSSNVTELQQYYFNAGFDAIPKPSATEQAQHMVEWDESPLTFEEEQMLAFENWMEQVYADEDDICLDDDDFMPFDNPAGPDYEKIYVPPISSDPESQDEETIQPLSSAVTTNTIDPLLKDVQEFEDKYAHMSQNWRDQYVKRYQYKIEQQIGDHKKEHEFRGHLVIACSPTENDLTLAETVTVRMERQFGTQVFVETRVISHAKEEDHLYEIWLESWDIDLLFSSRQAVFNPREWDGPRDLTQELIETLVKKVEFLVSDDARYSYRV